MKRSVLAPALALLTAPEGTLASSSAEPAALTVSATIENQAVSGHDAVLPSPAGTWLLLAPACEAERTTLRWLHLPSGAVYHQAVGGQVHAAAWVDDTRHVLLRRSASGETVLEATSPAGASMALDVLGPSLGPVAQAQAAASGCGLQSASFRLKAVGGPEGRVRLFLARRLDDRIFEIRRYILAVEDQVRVLERTHLRTPQASQGLRLEAAIPGLAGPEVALLWRGAGHAAPGRVELWHPGVAPVVSRTVYTLATAAEGLQDCSLATAGQLVCHSRLTPERGWLWRLRIGHPPVQLTRGGHAGAYALSPDGNAVAYVGSGALDGPLVLQDLETGAERVVPLGGPRCDGAVALPEVHWLEQDRLLVRGHCATALYLVGPKSADASPSAPTSGPSPEPPAPAAEVSHPSPPPKPPKATSRRRSSAFWSPRY
ncbi:MAG: hypothetical protein RMK29_15265 [Myxococcales bacterium]|nr:hypothetical protein [Myxococcota bacterium]MDW8283075.1 hypothetical protein [Myxococcales bacterium]